MTADGSGAWTEALRAQALAADPSASAYATANAGSGKTKVLIDRVARLLLRRPDGRPGARPDSILCLTYTRAAANEMMTRLFSRLGDWAVQEDDSLREALAGLENRSADSYSQADLRDARTLFARALETPGGLRIETIHAFCARILRRFPLEAGVMPGFSELEQAVADRLWSDARHAAILKAASDLPLELDLVAREAGGRGADAALDILRGSAREVLAFGASHGYDHEAMARAIRAGLSAPEQGRAEIVSEATGPGLDRVAVSECARALMQGGKTDLQRAAKLVALLEAPDPETAWQAYLNFFLTSEGDFISANPYTAKALDLCPDLKILFSVKDGDGTETARARALIDRVRRCEAAERTLALLRVGLPALQAYEAEKLRRGALDFDDLLVRTRDLLSEDGMSGWVLYKLDGEISHILIDEAQDTSPVQWELIQALTTEFTSGQGIDRKDDPRTVFIVGDEKQSIYSFQGAEPARLKQETSRLSEMMGPVHSAQMNMSFRSGPEILTFVDAVWNGAPELPGSEESGAQAGKREIRHTARRSGEAGCVEIWPVEARDTEEIGDAWERPVDVVRATSPKARLAACIAAGVKRMIGRQEQVWEGGQLRPIQPQDILILVSKRAGGLFDSLISSLKAEGIPVAGADRFVLTDFIGVQDCLNLMRFAVLDIRDLTLAEILRGPFIGLVDDDRYLFPLASGRRAGESLWSRVCASEDPDVRRAADFLVQVRAQADRPAFEFLSHVLDREDGDGKTGWQKLMARLGLPARDPVEALLSRALQHDTSGPASIQAFVSEIESERAEVKRDLTEAGEAVRVMTVHGAKGLQAPVVILPDTTFKPKNGDSGLLPVGGVRIWVPRKREDTAVSRRARLLAERRMLEEHRRLLYVALTRAQDRLIIAGHWFGSQGASNPGYDPSSWYALCLRAMEQLVPDADETGRRVFGRVQTATDTVGQEADREGAHLPQFLLEKVGSETNRRRVSAPTSLMSAHTRVMAPFEPGREMRLRRGRAIHALLQYLPEIDPDERDMAASAWLARDTAFTAEQAAEMKAAALGVLHDPGMAALFAPGGRAEAAIIGTGPGLPDGLVVNGRVDRLVITPGQVLIVDFKTDQPAPERVEDVAQGYISQMAAYEAVLRQAYPGREIVAALCWTDGPRLMRLPQALMARVLAEAQTGI